VDRNKSLVTIKAGKDRRILNIKYYFTDLSVHQYLCGTECA